MTKAVPDPGTTTATNAAESGEFEAATALPQVLKIVGSVVAPTTLLTALLFYFGLVYSIGYFRYFGVNFTVLDLPVQSYLMLSADGLIIPLICVAAVILLALWLYQLRLDTLPIRARRIVQRVLMPFSAIAGAVLVIMAMAHAVLGAPVFPATFLEARGLSLSIGILLLAYAARLRRMLSAQRRSPPLLRHLPDAVIVAKWGAVFILVSIGLFWAVGSYAIGVGAGQAQESAADLYYSPNITLYSEKSLSLTSSVHEVTCRNPDAAYRFRYDGLKLVPQLGSHYLFVPADWTQADGVAILIPRTEAVRLEFSWANQAPNPAC
jgi:hypothetical protein